MTSGGLYLMRRKIWGSLIIITLIILSACGKDNINLNEELPTLDVEFELPEFAEVGETIELKAIVTYDNEPVKDANEVNFEYWENDDKENSITIDSINHHDGTYTAEIIVENDAVYSVYAHTTAKALHTMPLRSVIVGSPDIEIDDNTNEAHHEGSDEFGMHFMDLEDVKTKEEIQLMVHLHMGDKPFEAAKVRYEIWNDDISDKHDWIDAEESSPGEYVAAHRFKEAGTYTIQIHVEDDDGLHEHEEHKVDVK